MGMRFLGGVALTLLLLSGAPPLPARAVLEGRVVGPNGDPVPAVRIVVVDSQTLSGDIASGRVSWGDLLDDRLAASMPASATDSSGGFRTRDLTPGRYLLFVRPPAPFAPQTVETLVEEGVEGHPMEIRVEPARRIRFQVADPQGRGIPGARVLWHSVNYGAGVRSAESGEDGTGVIAGLPGGPFYLEGAAGGYWGEFSPVLMLGPEEETMVGIELDPARSVDATVVLPDGVNPSEAHVTVRVPAAAMPPRTFAEVPRREAIPLPPDRTVRLAGLPPDMDVEVRVEVEGASPSEWIRIGRAQTEAVRLTIPAARIVSGSVRGPDGAPLAGAEVEVAESSVGFSDWAPFFGFGRRWRGTTGTDGAFSIAGVPVGGLVARARARPEEPFGPFQFIPAQVGQVQLALPPWTEVIGSAASPYSVIQAATPDGLWVASTWADGGGAFRLMVPRGIQVQLTTSFPYFCVMRTGYPTQPTLVAVGPQMERIEVSLASGPSEFPYSLVVRVFDETGPLPGVPVAVQRIAAPGEAYPFVPVQIQSYAGPGGVCRFSVPLHGSYGVQVMTLIPQSVPVDARVELNDAHPSADVPLTIPSGRVAGTTAGTDGAGPMVTFRLVALGGEGIPSRLICSTTGPLGPFLFQLVPPGRFVMEVEGLNLGLGLSDPFEVASGGTTVLPAMRLESPGLLRVHLASPAGQRGWATVGVSRGGYRSVSREQTVAVPGPAIVQNLGPGTYEVVVNAVGFQAVTRSVEVRAGREEEVTIDLAPQ